MTGPLDVAALAANLGWSLLAVLVMMAVTMAVAVAIGNQSIIDTVWGPGFAVIALVSFLASAPPAGTTPVGGSSWY